MSFNITTLGPTNLGHNKFGYYNFGYHNFSQKLHVRDVNMLVLMISCEFYAGFASYSWFEKFSNMKFGLQQFKSKV